jgi:hypothetical protein
MSLKSKLAKKLQVDHPTQEPQKINDTRFSSPNSATLQQGDEKKPGPASRRACKNPAPVPLDVRIIAERAEQKLKNLVTKEPAAKKIVKASMLLADYITPKDTQESVKVIREAKAASHYIYSKEEGGLVAVPDWRTRLAATTLERAYAEGTPVQRQIVLTGKFDTDDAIFDKVAGGQEALRAIETLSRLGIKVDYQRETPGDIIEAETFQSDEDSGDD